MIDYDKLRELHRLIDEYCKLKDILMDFTITFNRSSNEYPVAFTCARSDAHGQTKRYLNLETAIEEYRWLVRPEAWHD